MVFIAFIACYLLMEEFIYPELASSLSDLYKVIDSIFGIRKCPLSHCVNYSEIFLTYAKYSIILSILFCLPFIINNFLKFFFAELYLRKDRIYKDCLIAGPVLFHLGTASVFVVIFPVLVELYISELNAKFLSSAVTLSLFPGI
jgi:Sec-independent protein secretion pathway component TatC